MSGNIGGQIVNAKFFAQLFELAIDMSDDFVFLLSICKGVVCSVLFRREIYNHRRHKRAKHSAG